jgi:queuine/archaeosine tRNA-ribosyltransferase
VATGSINSELLPQLMQDICRELHPELIAVPERELGEGLFARARTVHKIRQSLNALGFYQPLHLLGTGNPISIAVYASVGADTFDGLEWCRTAMDAETGRLYHLQQYDLFSWQTEYATSPIAREAVTSAALAYPAKVVFHNLDAFSTWMTELREHANTGKIDRFLAARLPNATSNLRALSTAVPEVFS